MNKHGRFWLAVFSMLTVIEIIVFIIFGAMSHEVVTFRKEWCLLAIPNVFFMFWQFLENYFSLTEGKD